MIIWEKPSKTGRWAQGGNRAELIKQIWEWKKGQIETTWAHRARTKWNWKDVPMTLFFSFHNHTSFYHIFSQSVVSCCVLFFFSSRVDWRDKRCFLWELSKLLGNFLPPYIFPLPHLNKWVSFLLWSLMMAVTSICLEWSFTGVQAAAIVCFCLCRDKNFRINMFFSQGSFGWWLLIDG